jgi:site-specific recombinase XerD
MQSWALSYSFDHQRLPVIPSRCPAQKQHARRAPTVVVKPNYWRLVESFEWHMRAANMSPETLRIRRQSFTDFAAYLERESISLHVEAITQEHCNAYLADLMGGRALSPCTARIRHTSLHVLCKWLHEEGEIDVNPMRRVPRPKLEETPPAVMNDGQLARLLKVCAGRDFRARRDTAMIRVLLDCGLRRSELAGMRLDKLDLNGCTIEISGKTGTRRLPISDTTAAAIDRYLRVREVHNHASLPYLWLSHVGGLTGAGAYEIVRRRAKDAGIGKTWLHLFRHTFAHTWLAEGGQEHDLMRLAGWSSTAMVGRYGASAAHERAMEAHRRLGLGNRV